MSTHSNSQEEISDERGRETKLEKFIKAIDEDTVEAIENYLQSHGELLDQKNGRPERFKLYHDLTILLTFKKNQSLIYGRQKVNLKRLDQICQQLRQVTGFLSATIKQRVQKKLTGISKKQILDHIKLGIDFSFDSKKKLQPIKPSKQSRRGKKQASFDQAKQESECTPHISIKSSDEHDSTPVHQVQPPTLKYSIKKAYPDEAPRPAQPQNTKKPQYLLYNEFDAARLSDHESDEEILVLKIGDQVHITSHQSQQSIDRILNKICQSRLKQRQGQRQRQRQRDSIHNMSRMQECGWGIAEKENHCRHPNDLLLEQKDIEYPVQLQCLQQQLSEMIDESGEQYMQNEGPGQQQMSRYCCMRDWNLAKADPKQFGYLEWHKDEDQFLHKAVACPDPNTALKQLQVLKKYKQGGSSVMARIRHLNLQAPNYITARLESG